MKMIIKNGKLIERIRSKIRSSDCDIHKAVSLMEDYSDAVTAYNRGLISLKDVSRSEKVLWDFVGK